MNLFDLPQAKYFCRPFTVSNPTTQQSLKDFHEGLPAQVVRLREGNTHFEVHRTNLLNSAERWILYAATNYRRAVEMLVPGSTPWAHVTLYYSSFFAANAILAMFGGWVAETVNGNRMVDVEEGTPGLQRLRVHRRVTSPNGARGSHRRFWDFFYESVASLAAWTPVELSQALRPSTGDYAWQIRPRNEVNYDMFRAWRSSVDLRNTFNPRRLDTLTGPIGLQLEATECLGKLAQHYAKEVSLHSFGIVDGNDIRTRLQVQRELATQKAPRIIGQSAFGDMIKQ